MRTLIPLLFALLSTSAGAEHMVFGDSGRGWFVFDSATGEARPLAVPSGRSIAGIDISSDGKMVAFTAYDPQAQNTLLFSLNEATRKVERIGNDRGFHSNPRFSPDGRWVYFAHNPEAMGPPGQHGMKAFAQIYRVRTDGTSLEQLTSGRGCHFAPAVSRRLTPLFIHSNCSTERLIKMKSGSDEKRWATEDMAFEETEIDESGEIGFVTAAGRSDTAILKVTSRGGTAELLCRVPRDGIATHRLRFDERQNALFYQARGEVWRKDPVGSPRTVLSLRELKR